MKETLTSAARAVIALLFFCHGLQGFGFLGGVDGAGGAPEFGAWPFWYAAVLELVGSVLLFLGLFTREVAVVLSGAMAYAYFVVHQPIGLLPLQNQGEAAALYSWIFLLIAAVGPGRYALDTFRRRAETEAVAA
ncbi:DoxX family protein [Lentzea sp. NPDC051838]|uniref:DoxX family protein n=1 Tax=Lentzea sp. NPDC051838 TaxID=3154849 RepID=UPI00341A087D